MQQLRPDSATTIRTAGAGLEGSETAQKNCPFLIYRKNKTRFQEKKSGRVCAWRNKSQLGRMERAASLCVPQHGQRIPRASIYLAFGFSRRTQCMGCPWLSASGSTPKYLRRAFRQLSRSGRGRFFWPRSRNTASDVVRCARGASSPKRRMACL